MSYLYTSGTTSFPKGVVGSHTAIYLESLMMVAETQLGPADRVACIMPLFHTAQLNGFCTPVVMAGGTQYLMRAFDAAALLELIERERITRTFVLPMMWRALVEHPDVTTRDLSSLTRGAYAMAPMPDALLRRCIETFECGFHLSFGQTEMSPVTTYFRPEDQLSHSGAVGSQVMNVEIAIMDPDGHLLPRGEEGEIVYRSPQALNEYLRNPEATAAAFAHGWFHSGDAGMLAEDGMLWFSDRYKDVIKSGGENVASIEVEKAVYAAAPSVAEVAVVGLPHERWTEAITAVVTAKEGETVDPTEVLAATRRHIADFKAPKAVTSSRNCPARPPERSRRMSCAGTTSTTTTHTEVRTAVVPRAAGPQHMRTRSLSPIMERPTPGRRGLPTGDAPGRKPRRASGRRAQSARSGSRGATSRRRPAACPALVRSHDSRWPTARPEASSTVKRHGVVASQVARTRCSPGLLASSRTTVAPGLSRSSNVASAGARRSPSPAA